MNSKLARQTQAVHNLATNDVHIYWGCHMSTATTPLNRVGMLLVYPKPPKNLPLGMAYCASRRSLFFSDATCQQSSGWSGNLQSADSLALAMSASRLCAPVGVVIRLLQNVSKLAVAWHLWGIDSLALAPGIFYPAVPAGCCLCAASHRLCQLLQRAEHALQQCTVSTVVCGGPDCKM